MAQPYLDFAAKVSAATASSITIVSTTNAQDPAGGAVVIGTMTLTTVPNADAVHFVAGDTINVRITNQR